MPEEIEGYDKGDTFFKICKSEEHTHYQLVKHYHKYHENKAPFVCNKCGKLNAWIICVHKHLLRN